MAVAVARARRKSTLAQSYNGLLAAYPYRTKAIGTGVTYMFSDATAQLIEAEDVTPSERCKRALKFGAVGALWVGPLLAVWFQVMESLVPGKALRPVAAKLVADQVLQGPFMIGTMFAWTSISNGLTLPEIRSKLDHHLWPTWIKSVYVWGPVQAMQQMLVPLQYRVMVANGVSYFWDTYLSLMMMESGAEPSALPAECCFGVSEQTY